MSGGDETLEARMITASIMKSLAHELGCLKSLCLARAVTYSACTCCLSICLGFLHSMVTSVYSDSCHGSGVQKQVFW